MGLFIDSKLSFSCQVDYVCKKLSRFRGISYALAPLLPVNTLCSLYYSLAYPFLIQNVIIWGGLNETNLSRIQVAMNKILRDILQVRFDENHIPVESTNVMYKTFNFLKSMDVYNYFLLKFIHKNYYENFDLFHDNFLDLLSKNTYN